MKKCSRCYTSLEEAQFCKCASSADGLHSWCASCRKQYRIDNKEQINKKSKEYSELNKEAILKRSRENHAKHRDKELELGRAYYYKNKDKVKASLALRADKISELQKKYYLANKEQLNEKQRDYHRNNKPKARDRKLQRAFGLTLEEYNNKLSNQNNICAICGGVDNDRSLAVDHDHTTGKIRDLLCKSCNLILGRVKEDTSILENMVAYLKRHKD